MKAAFVALFLVCACTPASNLKPFEREAGDAVAAAWAESGLPAPTQGRCDVSKWRVRTDDAVSFQNDCHVPAPAAGGCTAWADTDAMFAWREYPVVVISPAWKSEPGIIIHELMHAYWHCAEMPNELGPDNIDHKDPRVWQAAGGDASVQARALAIVAKTTSL